MCDTFTPYILPVTMSFLSFRAYVAKTLGFETFVPESLNDLSLQYAFLVPQETSMEVAEEVRDFLMVCFTNKGFRVANVSWFNAGVYDYNWCGSRHRTAELECHWLFEVVPETTTPYPIPPNPSCDRWLVVEVDYDDLRPQGSRVRFDTTYMTAATPLTFKATLDRVREHVAYRVANHAKLASENRW